MSCRLPPPRSATIPSRIGRLNMAASAPSRASSRPVRTRTATPSRSRKAPSSRSRFVASRTAAVAIATTRGDWPFRTRRRKRWTQSSVASTASGRSRPGGPSPSRVCTRSFWSTSNPRPSTTLASRKREAFEPRSTSATSSAVSARAPVRLTRDPGVVHRYPPRVTIDSDGPIAGGPSSCPHHISGGIAGRLPEHQRSVTAVTVGRAARVAAPAPDVAWSRRWGSCP